jgi:hypothetical protein
VRSTQRYGTNVRITRELIHIYFAQATAKLHLKLFLALWAAQHKVKRDRHRWHSNEINESKQNYISFDFLVFFFLCVVANLKKGG